MEISFKPPRYLRSYLEMLGLLQESGVEIHEEQIITDVMKDCEVVVKDIDGKPSSTKLKP